MPKEHFSLGTTIELGWAIGMRKPIVLVTDDEFVSKNPLVVHNASYEVFSEVPLTLDEDIPDSVLEDVVEIVIGLCGVYT
jgi:nucleoside 2-deoxyribosyltransferase